jgi:hypothetical protein
MRVVLGLRTDSGRNARSHRNPRGGSDAPWEQPGGMGSPIRNHAAGPALLPTSDAGFQSPDHRLPREFRWYLLRASSPTASATDGLELGSLPFAFPTGVGILPIGEPGCPHLARKAGCSARLVRSPRVCPEPRSLVDPEGTSKTLGPSLAEPVRLRIAGGFGRMPIVGTGRLCPDSAQLHHHLHAPGLVRLAPPAMGLLTPRRLRFSVAGQSPIGSVSDPDAHPPSHGPRERTPIPRRCPRRPRGAGRVPSEMPLVIGVVPVGRWSAETVRTRRRARVSRKGNLRRLVRGGSRLGRPPGCGSESTDTA